MSQEETEYEIAEAHRLPFVDVNKSLKRALLTPAGVKTYKAVCKRINFLCVLLYTIAFPIGASVLTVPTQYARVLAIFKFLFQVPMLIMTSAGLRVDLLWCLVTTYEFWFFTILNAMTCVVFSLHLGDLRMIMAPVYWYGIQMNIWADGKVQGPKLASAAALAAVYHIFLLVVFGLQLTPDPHPVELVNHSGRSMTSSDFLMNSFTTMMILMARTAFRKRALHKRSDDDPKTMRFVSYRCRVKLREKPRASTRRHQNGPTLPENVMPPTDNVRQPAPATPGNEQIVSPPAAQRLRFVKQKMTFNSKDVLLPTIADWMSRSPSWKLALLYATGALGFGLHVIAFACIHFSVVGSLPVESFVVLSLLSLLCASSFCGAYVALHHRQLLMRLVTSFDFIFVSLQITFGYVCACGILSWDSRCVVFLTDWIWKHWILTLDGLTPQMKSLLGFRARFAIPIVVFSVIVQLFSSVELLFNASEELQSRVFWSASLFSHHVEIRAVPFYLSRAYTVFLWSVRILWRFLCSGDDDLIMIQGSVEFYGNPKALGHTSKSPTKPRDNQIAPLQLAEPARIQSDQ